jgi:hypothetical protein
MRLRHVLVALLYLVCHAGAFGSPSVSLAAPAGARVETLADDFVLDGLKSRMVRVLARSSVEDLAVFYKRTFGEKHVDNVVAGARVIAAREGAVFHTVQLRRVNEHTSQATILSTEIPDGRMSATAVTLDTHRLLPAASAVVSSMQSNDAGKRSMLLVAVNKNDLRTNRDHIVAGLAQRGFRVIKEQSPSDGDARPAVSLVLSSGSEEAAVTIADVGGYRSILINRTRDTQP